MAKHNTLHAVEKGTLMGRVKNRSISANEWIAVLEEEHAQAKTSHTWLARIAAPSNASAKYAREKLQGLIESLCEAEKVAEQETDKPDNLRK